VRRRVENGLAGFMLIAGSAFGQGGITLAGAGYTAPSPIRVAPGQVITLRLTGLKTILPASAPTSRAASVPLPTSLAGISVTLAQSSPLVSEQLPIFAVQQLNNCGTADFSSLSPDCIISALTVQIPFDLNVPNPLVGAPVVVAASVTIHEASGSSRSFTVIPVADNIHILTACDLLVSSTTASLVDPTTTCTPVVVHGNGTPVSLSNPAKLGEELVVYAVGLGLTSPIVTTGNATPIPAPSVISQAVVAYDYTDPLGIQPSTSMAVTPLPPTLFAGLTPGLVGLYQVNFRVLPPSGAFPSCSAVGPNLTLTLKTPQGTSDKASVCVDTITGTSTMVETPSASGGTSSVSFGDFVPNTISFPVGADLRFFGKPVPPEALGVPGPNTTAIRPAKP